ncbi:hypothetical protein [Thermoactinomyces sp. DSM 45891]|uniref:hypothetical protein n=1 Tax=Thermoactinomyces sp. DSM 45891 TaxID=1761907 RepID=UPI00116127F5|nr:hypothetical protein [Thermoactinomyces sp. DSM 45891]
MSFTERLYSNRDFQYYLSYVDRKYWENKLINAIKDIGIDNLTDFNYATCFSLFVYPSDIGVKLSIGGRNFANYLAEHKVLNAVMIRISAIAPYSVIHYWKYEHADEGNKLTESAHSLDEFTQRVGEGIKDFLQQFDVKQIPEECLNIVVPDISLELKEENATIFNCLFEDNY